ncbi:Hypothetical predicted protein [Lynx pardinus]|uniref:Uncharacterized protein n=1 Tax=Lynx pardinus TaxID=191816 RepID=A0A485PEV9_LYNPA|nr:Hypothetical predicted protein [Lynx pardinus]
MAQRRKVREALNTHELVRNHSNSSSSIRLQDVGPSSSFFPRTMINLQQTHEQCELCDNPAQITITNISERRVLDSEAHIVPRKSFTQSFMVHFNRVYFSCNVDWRRGDNHAECENTSLHLALGTNTASSVRCLGQADVRACQLDELLAGCNPEPPAALVPLALPSLHVTFDSLNQGMLAVGSSVLSLFQPEIGSNSTVLWL